MIKLKQILLQLLYIWNGEISMLTIEEYITRRKKDLEINEFDENKITENATALNQIVNEYFEKYIEENTNKLIKTSAQVNNFRKQIDHYSIEVQDYLVEAYSTSGKYIHRPVENVLKEDRFLFIRDTDEEIEKLVFDSVEVLKDKLPYLETAPLTIEKLIREYIDERKKCYKKDNIPNIHPKINEWINETEVNHNVSLPAFADELALTFSEQEKMWPPKRKTIDERLNLTYYKYDYKTEGNRFNLNELYEEIPGKPFLKNQKKYLEVLVMYYWLHSIDTDEEYWHEYLNKFSL